MWAAGHVFDAAASESHLCDPIRFAVSRSDILAHSCNQGIIMISMLTIAGETWNQS